MSEIAEKSPEQKYVDSVENVVNGFKHIGAPDEVVMAFATIWAQAKASELTTLNVVREQLAENGRGEM